MIQTSTIRRLFQIISRLRDPKRGPHRGPNEEVFATDGNASAWAVGENVLKQTPGLEEGAFHSTGNGSRFREGACRPACAGARVACVGRERCGHVRRLV